MLFRCADKLVRKLLKYEAENGHMPDIIPASTEVMDYISLVRQDIHVLSALHDMFAID